MTRRADVAVVGGGVIGLAVASALAGRDVDVIVLERGPAFGQGSSARANGGIRAQFTTAINITFSLYSIGELEHLHSSSGGLVGLHQSGYLLFTGDEQTEASLRRAYELQRSLGVTTEWLAPDEIVARAPLVRAEGLRAGTFHARDGFIDPHGVLAALTAEARSRGATLLTRAEVSAIERSASSYMLATGAGEVQADWVVDAAGPHAAEVAALAGVGIPVEPVRRNLAFLPDEPGELIPMCVDLDTGVLVRREVGGGFVLAYSNPDDAPGFDDSVDPKFLEDLAARIGDRFPSLEDHTIDPHHCWAGLYPETPDHHAIIGVAAEAERFVVCAGFGGHGIMHAPAAGLAVAELIVDGACSTFELDALRPTRFADGDLVVETAVL